MNLRRFVIITAVAIVILASILGGALADRLFGLKPLEYLFPQGKGETGETIVRREVLQEESVVIDVAERISPAVVTISAVSPFPMP